MSFSPLPELFHEQLEMCRNASARVLDLGCGDGSFFADLPPLNGRLIGLDRVRPLAGTSAQVVSDARFPGLKPQSFDLVVAANLFRHIIADDPRAGFLSGWCGLLRPGGTLFLFEDEPADSPGAVKNYRDLQEFLLRLMPSGRGPLLPRSSFERLMESAEVGTDWLLGFSRNQVDPNLEAVRSLLLSGEGPVEGERSRLLHALEEDGLAYGDFWWACWRADPA